MKTPANYLSTANAHTLNGTRQTDTLAMPRYLGLEKYGAHYSTLKPERSSFLNEEAMFEMTQGSIPNLENVCRDLYSTFLQPGATYSAMQFIPILKKLGPLNAGAVERFLVNPKTNHVLVQHALIKVVLIHWTPGKVSSVHGHPQGGCVFKVLQGRLEEKRYSPDEAQQLLAVSSFQAGSMAYIDDNLAYHAVGNPFDAPAISLHVYTPGKK